MNCRDAELLIFATRDGAPDETRRAPLAEHLAQCPACRAMQSELEAAATAWRSADAAASVPVVEVEWHAIRRRIRGEAPEAASGPARWLRPLLWTMSTATAALALAMFVVPRWFQDGSPDPSRDSAYVSYVKVFNTSDETMVYEDAESGWLVVWVSNGEASSGT